MPDVDPFYEKYNKQLITAQNDLNRFAAAHGSDEEEKVSSFLVAVIGILAAFGLFAIHGKHRKKAE